MILRPRQKQFVERSVKALADHRNTLAVAPTGAGKTIMLSGVVGDILKGNDAKACILAHRDELTTQNVTKFTRVNPDIRTSIYDANTKSWHGRVTFAMVPTLSRHDNLVKMPKCDLLVIDEAHHAAADSYLRIIDTARNNNPDCLIYGVTATPNRGDRKGLRDVFSNCADQIKLGELIASGHLVKPRTFVIDVGTQADLKKVKKTAQDFDMSEVEAIMNTRAVNDAVISHWNDKAGDRQTVIFCSTVAHADDVTQAFCAAGVPAVLIHGDLDSNTRRSRLKDFETGRAQVVVNVAVLTEGWDWPPTSCVILLRPSSYKSTMVQMIGRGLRVVDPTEHPGVIKNDCVILDFGISSLMHGSLETDVDLDGRKPGDGLTKECPECTAEVPLSADECPICGYVWPEEEEDDDDDEEDGGEEGGPGALHNFVMTEIDLLARSSFIWSDLFGDDTALIATGFNGWGGVFFWQGQWYAVGGSKDTRAHLVAIGEKLVCIAAADDWLNSQETDDTAHKTRRWLNLPPTEKQIPYLPPEMKLNATRYSASCWMTWKWNSSAVKRLVFTAASRRAA